MGQFTINYPDEKLQDILDAFATAYEYKENIDDPENPGQTIPNPETKAQHAKRQLTIYVRSIVKANHPAIVSANATTQAAKATVAADAEIDIT
jgi:hypothetical protein